MALERQSVLPGGRKRPLRCPGEAFSESTAWRQTLSLRFRSWCRWLWSSGFRRCRRCLQRIGLVIETDDFLCDVNGIRRVQEGTLLRAGIQHAREAVLFRG